MLISQFVNDAEELSEEGIKAGQDIRELDFILYFCGDRMAPVRKKIFKFRRELAKTRLRIILFDLDVSISAIQLLTRDNTN